MDMEEPVGAGVRSDVQGLWRYLSGPCPCATCHGVLGGVRLPLSEAEAQAIQEVEEVCLVPGSSVVYDSTSTRTMYSLMS